MVSWLPESQENKNQKNHEKHIKNDQYLTDDYNQSPDHQHKPKMNIILPQTITSQNNVNIQKSTIIH
jgi:hypothetical protein